MSGHNEIRSLETMDERLASLATQGLPPVWSPSHAPVGWYAPEDDASDGTGMSDDESDDEDMSDMNMTGIEDAPEDEIVSRATEVYNLAITAQEGMRRVWDRMNQPPTRPLPSRDKDLALQNVLRQAEGEFTDAPPVFSHPLNDRELYRRLLEVAERLMNPEQRANFRPGILVSTLPTRQLTAADFDESGECLCSICLDSLELGAEVVVMRRCTHLFHRDCAGQWLEANRTCPNCRQRG